MPRSDQGTVKHKDKGSRGQKTASPQTEDQVGHENRRSESQLTTGGPSRSRDRELDKRVRGSTKCVY